MEDKEIKRFLRLMGEHMVKRAKEELEEGKPCMCDEIPDGPLGDAFTEFVMGVWTHTNPAITGHIILHAYQVGKQVAQEEMLNLMVKEPN